MLLSMSLALYGVGAVYAAESNDVNAGATVSTGIVDIDLTMPQEQEENVVSLTEYTVHPVIKNNGASSYIRLLADFDFGSLTDKDGMSCKATDVTIENDGWTYSDDGYFYYTEAVDEGETVSANLCFTTPDFGQTEESGSFSLDVKADAVQSANFTPDFDKESPWGNVEIEEVSYDSDGTGKFSSDTVSTSLSLKLSKTTLFSDVEYLMPGSTVTDSIDVTYTGENKADVYFSAESPSESKLADVLQLTISNNGTEMYSGDLSQSAIKEAVKIATLNKNESATLDFSLSVPEELNNSYTMKDVNLKWNFSSKTIEEETTQPATPSNNVKTGDATNTTWLVVILIIATIVAMAGIGMIVKERREHDESK